MRLKNKFFLLTIAAFLALSTTLVRPAYAQQPDSQGLNCEDYRPYGPGAVGMCSFMKWWAQCGLVGC